MAKLNLKKLSFNELVVLREQVQAELSRKIGAERSALQKQIDALAGLEAGGGAGVITPVVKRGRRGSGASKPATTKKKIAPKYRAPSGETWTGRGRAPRWLTQLEAAGKKRESYLI